MRRGSAGRLLVLVRHVAASPDSYARRLGGRVRFLAVSLMVIDSVATALMIATPVPTADAPDGFTLVIALLLGILLGGAQTACAIALGRRLRPTPHYSAGPRHPPGKPQWVALAIGAALALLSTPVGWAIFAWSQARVAADHEQLAVLLGMALALSAWLAPWLLVLDAAEPEITRRRSRRSTGEFENLPPSRKGTGFAAS